MLNIINNQGNANQDYTRWHFTGIWVTEMKKIDNTKY